MTRRPSFRRTVPSLWLALLLLVPASAASALASPGTPDAIATEPTAAESGAQTTISAASSEVPHDLRLIEVVELGVNLVQLRFDRRPHSLRSPALHGDRPRLRAGWRRAARTREHAGALGCSRCAEDTAFDATPPPAPPRAH